MTETLQTILKDALDGKLDPPPDAKRPIDRFVMKRRTSLEIAKGIR